MENLALRNIAVRGASEFANSRHRPGLLFLKVSTWAKTRTVGKDKPEPTPACSGALNDRG
jgi:hypothetical protein